MKKRILAVLLCLVLAVSLLPMAALAEGVTIKKVSMAIFAPEEGKHPEFPTVYFGSGNGLCDVGNYAWEDMSAGGASMSSYETFIAGHSYRLTLILAAGGENIFGGTYPGMVDINGTIVPNSDVTVSMDGKKMTVKYTFPAIEDLATDVIGAVNVGVDTPAPGAAPGVPTISTANSTLVDYEWSPAPATFTAGQTYRLTVTAERTSVYYKYTDHTAVLVGGKTATISAVSNTSITFYYDFYVAEVAKTKLNLVQLTVNAPKEGELPKFLADITSAAYTLYPDDGGSYIGGVCWTDETVDPNLTDPQRILKNGGSFLPGHTYRVILELAAADGYTFTESTKGYINGETAETFLQGDILRVTYLFPALPAPAVLTSIQVLTPPTKTEYKAGEVFDETGMVVHAVYSDGFHAPVIGYTISPNGALSENDKVITIEYSDGDVSVTTTTPITVTAAPKVLTSIAITTPPAKTVYTVGESFDPAGMVVTATYSDGSSKPVTGYAVPVEPLTESDEEVGVLYTEENVTQVAIVPITVKPAVKLPTIDAIALTLTAPVVGEHPSYSAGAAGPNYQIYTGFMVNGVAWLESETLDGLLKNEEPMKSTDVFKAGYFYAAVIAVIADDGYAWADSLLGETPAITINGTAGGQAFDEGEKELLVMGVFQPQAQSKTLESIAITTPPTKTTYTAGQAFDPAGMVVTATYSDQSTAAVTGYTVTPTALTVNDSYVTVSYTEGDVTKTATVAVTVKAPKVLASIAVTKTPYKTEYTSGDAFDAAGMVVTATYTDGATDTVAGYTVTPKILSQGDAYVTVSYTEGNVTKTATVAVTVKKSAKVNPFIDVFETDYYYDAVLWAYYAEPQVTNGMSATEFGPKNTVTRGQAVTFLWRAMGRPEPKSAANPFVDVPSNEYYYKAVLWAVEKGITKGTDDTHFTPGQTCSTAHIITFLYRTLGIGADGWGEVSAAWAKGAGLLDGLNVTVAPGVDCPRCDVVLFLHRAVG